MCSRPGGVDEDDVGALRDALLDRVEGDRGRVAALGAAHRAGADPLAPGLELVGGGGAEGVGRAEHHAAAVGDEHPGELAGGGGLAGAVDADDHHDARGVARPRSVLHGAVEVGAEQREQLLAQQRAQLVGRTGAEHLDALAQPLDQLLGGRDADVGGEQGVLDLLPGVLVEVLAGEQREQPLAEGVLRAGRAGRAAGPAGRRWARGPRSAGAARRLGSSTAAGAGGRGVREVHLLDGAARFVARGLGLVADVRFGGRGGDGRACVGGRRGQLLLPAAADHEPADRAEHDHGDDYSKDDGFHNPPSISHEGGASHSPRHSLIVALAIRSSSSSPSARHSPPSPACRARTIALGPVAHLELGEDRADVVTYGLVGDHQPLGDLPVAETARQQVQHLPFPGR